MPAPPPTAAAPDLPLGVGLASASALFIGSSFIVKKKGLQRAGVTGVRAGRKTWRGKEGGGKGPRAVLF